MRMEDSCSISACCSPNMQNNLQLADQYAAAETKGSRHYCNSTQGSRATPQPIANWAQSSLTSLIGRLGMGSWWYGCTIPNMRFLMMVNCVPCCNVPPDPSSSSDQFRKTSLPHRVSKQCSTASSSSTICNNVVLHLQVQWLLIYY